MNTKSKVVIAMLALGASAWVIIAQDNGGPRDGQRPPRRQNGDNQPGGPRGQGGPGGPGGQDMRGRRPVPPVVLALDTDHDGIVDADEIANAPAALRKLDRNGDGRLTMDELMPPPPQAMGGPGNGDQRPGDGQGRPPRRNGGPNFDGPPGPPPGDQ